MKKRLFLFLRIFISFTLIGFLLWMMRGKLDKIAITIKNADILYLIMGLFIYNISVFLMSARLKKVLDVQGLGITLKESVYLSYLGYFFNNFLPTAIGGDVVKAYYAGKKSNKRAAAFSAVAMDRLLAMLPFTLLPMCSLLFINDKLSNPAITYAVFLLFALTIFVISLFFSKRLASCFKFIYSPFKHKEIYNKIKKLYDMLNVYKHHKIVLAWNFILSLFSQSLFILSVFFLARSIGVDNVPISIFFLLVPIIGVISMVPSINGLGVREASIVYLFKDYIPADTAFAVSLLVLASLLCLSVIGGLIYAFKKDIYAYKPEMEEDVL